MSGKRKLREHVKAIVRRIPKAAGATKAPAKSGGAGGGASQKSPATGNGRAEPETE